VLLEFFINRFRRLEPISIMEVIEKTGVSLERLYSYLNVAQEKRWIKWHKARIELTDHGQAYLNDVLELFLDEPS